MSICKNELCTKNILVPLASSHVSVHGVVYVHGKSIQCLVEVILFSSASTWLAHRIGMTWHWKPKPFLVNT